MSLWNVKLGEKPTKVHVALCLRDHCPYADEIITKIQAKAGVEVILGTHPYTPEKVFAA
jgi:predicted metal-binding protein